MRQDNLKYEIIPGILDKNWETIERKIELVRSFAKTIHVDIIDGKFAQNITWIDPKPFKKFADDFFLEVHMMVIDPLQYVQSFADAGFRRFLGHVEHMESQVDFVAKAQELGEAGLAVDGPTDLKKIHVPLTDLDCLLVYTSEKVGFSGPAFVEDRLGKVQTLRWRDEFLPLEVDGGINDETIVNALESGANRFASTSFLFGSDPKAQYDKLKLKIDDFLARQVTT